jgi:hypothetical protein
VKKLFLFLSIILLVLQANAQSPQKMSFQAVIRKSNNSLVMMQPVSMRISILQGNENGKIVFQETHKPITNSNGLVSLEIGTGSIISGIFSNINWGNGPYYIKTETDPFCGVDYSIVGVSEFLSVPYALFAMNSIYSNYTGNSNSVLSLAIMETGINFSMMVTPGLAYNESNNILISNGIENHIHAIVVAYNAVTGMLLLNPFEITGIGTFNSWTINLDGSRGANGVVGLQGPQGLIGLTGTAGSQGLQGVVGNIGSQGIIGTAGTNGLNGVDGATGLIGATGVQGIIGLQGPQGLIGLTGAAGSQGLQGVVGNTGAQGLIGTEGINGLNGVDGAIGGTGLQGVIGLTGSQGLQGVVGNTGAQGLIGTAGANGLNGVDGSSGATGLQGVIGLTGSQGLQGVVGNTGAQGIIGLAGVNGLNGVDGATGPAGGFDALTILSPVNGGTGIANNALSTLTLSGSNPMTFSNTGITNITFPISGTLYGTANASISSLELLNSLSDKTGTGNAVFAISPVFTSVPTAPTAAIGTSTTQLATTAFVMQNLQSHLSVAAANEISTSSTTDEIAGDMTLTPGAGKYYVTFNSAYTIAPSDRTGQSKTDLRAAYNSLMAKTNTITDHAPTYGGGEILKAGVYANAGACTAVGSLTLDAENNSNAEFVFKYGAAFSTAANTTIHLINGASACNVYWIAEGAIALGVSTSMQGTIISNNGAVTTGNSCIMVGRLYSNNGAVGLDGSNISLPTGCTSSTYYGMLNSFVAFTSTGNITNLGGSVVTGDIGTNFGGVTGFSTATVNGTIYEPSIVPSSTTASFSIFQNEALIPFSTRTRISTLNLAEISLSAIATVGASETINIRWRIDAGTIKFQNRILTLIAVK